MRFGAIALAALLVLAGCGGGSGPAAPAFGRAVFTVIWPDTSRLVPVASNSVTISIGSSPILAQVVPKPAVGNTATATFDQVPVGPWTVTASAYPNADGTGVAQAKAAVPIQVFSGIIAHVDLTMASTIVRLDVTPANPVVTVGDGVQLIMTPRNAAGQVVLVSPATVAWSSGAATIATTDNNGGISTLLAGQAPITVAETESGRSSTDTVTVKLRITVAPTAATIPVNGQAQFTATVVGTADKTVKWSVAEGAAGGVVSQAGLYTAPAAKGTFHVVATANADPTRSAAATVTVQSGTGEVIIQ